MGKISQGFSQNLGKSCQNMSPNRPDAKHDLFGNLLFQLINQDHPPGQGDLRILLENAPGKSLPLLQSWEKARRK